MQKTLMIIAAIFCYYVYSGISYMKTMQSNSSDQLDEIYAYLRVFKDALKSKDAEIFEQKNLVKKMRLNTKAWEGTDCIRCHLDPAIMLPLNNHYLDVTTFISYMRDAKLHNPIYENKPTKTRNDITDSELRRQYSIIAPLYDLLQKPMLEKTPAIQDDEEPMTMGIENH